MVILDYIGNQTIHCSFKNDVHVTYSRNLRWSEPITFQYYSLAPTWSYCIVCHYGSTQNSAVNHLAPTQCPYLARLVLQILEPSCTQLLSNGCNLTTMMSLPGPLSGAIFSANPGWYGSKAIGCKSVVFVPPPPTHPKKFKQLVDLDWHRLHSDRMIQKRWSFFFLQFDIVTWTDLVSGKPCY